MYEQIRKINVDSKGQDISAESSLADLSNHRGPSVSSTTAEATTESSTTSPSVLLYHSTPLSNFTSIIRNGLFLSTDDWTVSTVPIGGEIKSVVFIVFKVAQDRLIETRLTSDGSNTTIPENVRTNLKLWDRFFLPQDTYYSTTAKPEWLRFKVSRAHNLLHSEQQGTLTYIPVSSFELDKMLEINRGRAGFELIQRELAGLGSSRERPESSKSMLSRIQDNFLQIAGTLYKLIPKWETRAFKEHVQRDAVIKKVQTEARNP